VLEGVRQSRRRKSQRAGQTKPGDQYTKGACKQADRTYGNTSKRTGRQAETATDKQTECRQTRKKTAGWADGPCRDGAHRRCSLRHKVSFSLVAGSQTGGCSPSTERTRSAQLTSIAESACTRAKMDAPAQCPAYNPSVSHTLKFWMFKPPTHTHCITGKVSTPNCEQSSQTPVAT